MKQSLGGSTEAAFSLAGSGLGQKRKNLMTKHHLYATINSKHYISVNTTPQHIFLPVRITLKRADHFAFFNKDMEIFNALCYQLIAGKLKCQM